VLINHYLETSTYKEINCIAKYGVGFNIRKKFYLPRYKSLPIILHRGKWTATGA
jgi:hypothetical protein